MVSGIQDSETPIDTRNWGPVDDDDIETLQIPDGKNWVKVKRYITEGDDAAASQAAIAKGVSVSTRTGKGRNADGTQTYHFDTAAHRAVMLKRMIREWSFTDRQHRVIPINAQTIAALPVFTRDFIMEQIDKLNPSADVPDPDVEEELDQHGNNTGPLDEPTNDI